MFVDTSLGVMSLALPDVCEVPVLGAPVPTPMVNLMFSSSRLPMVMNVNIGGGPALNILGVSELSTGDEAGLELGVVSGLIAGPGSVVLGSTKLFLAAAPATSMCDITAQNGFVPNAAGMTLSASQWTVMVLC